MRIFNLILVTVILFSSYPARARTCTQYVHEKLGVKLDCGDWTCTAWDQSNWAGGWVCSNDTSQWSTNCPACEYGEPAPGCNLWADVEENDMRASACLDLGLSDILTAIFIMGIDLENADISLVRK